MKKLLFLLTLILVTVSLPTLGQNFDDLVKGSKADANYLVTGYSTPFIKAIAGGLNQGWYNTADTHKFFGADLTISVSLISIPSSDKKFTVDNSKMTTLQLDGTAGGKGQLPTFFGGNTSQTLSLKANSLIKYNAPDGIKLGMLPIPVANLGLSLPKGTDIKVRYIPTLNLGDAGKLGLFGAAIQHDIKQWIPGIKELPFSLAVLVGYTKLTTKLTFDKSNPNNTGNFNVASTTAQVLISKKISVLTVYGGVGYNFADGKLNMKGKYDTNGDGDANGPEDLTDPVQTKVNASSARVTGGIRLKFGPITFHGDYTLQKYSAITAGFGIYVR